MMQEVEGIIQDIAFGGEGILRVHAKAIFVPFTAPQDEGVFTLTKEKKKYSFGKIKILTSPSTTRTTPPCPIFGKCGGCQFQHLSYPTQLKIKEKFIKDALTRIGKINPPILPILPAPKQFAYREHITLHLRIIDNNLSAGYIGYDPSAFIPVSSCPIFCQTQDPVFEKLQKILNQLDPVPFERASVKLLKTENPSYVATFFFTPEPPPNIKKVLEAHTPEWAALSLGVEEFEFSFLGLQMTSSSQNFLQNFKEQSENLHSHILSLVSPSSQKILDLYCGIGLTSLLLAREGKKVVGVEWNKNAISLASLNAEKNRLHAEFKQGKVEDQLSALLKKFQPDSVILNPPRTGLNVKVIEALNRNPPKELIYISCMPPTLARDLAQFKKFHIQHVQPFDMFPQTTHVETVVLMTHLTHQGDLCTTPDIRKK